MSASNLLKTETSDLHATVEQSIDWSHWLGTVPQYGQFLLRMISFLPEVDQRCDEVLGTSDAWFTDRRRASWAAADLRDLQSSQQLDNRNAIDIDTVVDRSSHADQFVWVDDAPTAAGVLYVLEGSTMGGKQLCHLVRAGFPADTQVPLRYLSGYGDQTGRHWQVVKAWLDRILVAADDQTKAVEAAKRMFVVFGEQLGSEK